MNSDRNHTRPGPCSPTDSPPRRHVKVVGYDGSTNGPNVVEGAARRVGAGDRLVIVHAVQPGSGQGDPSVRHDDVRHQLHEKLLGKLDPNVLEGIDYELRVVDGPVAPALIKVALDTRAIGIVIGTRRGPTRLGQRTIRAELEAGPVPVVALYRTAQRESHPLAEPFDSVHRHGHDSFPASDPPPSWSAPDDVPTRTRAPRGTRP